MRETLQIVCPLNRTITSSIVNCAIELSLGTKIAKREDEDRIRADATREFDTLLATLNQNEVVPLPQHKALIGFCVQRTGDSFVIKRLPETPLPEFKELANSLLRNQIPKTVFNLLTNLHTPGNLRLPQLTIRDLQPAIQLQPESV